MSVYVMADLHLSSNGEKSMEKFGTRWNQYMEKIKKNWTAIVHEEDTVILPGDISWGLRPEDAVEDFLFLEALPGTKLLGKGNHDFWWTTQNKLQILWKEHGIKSLKLLYNNAYRVEDFIVCGTRGWFIEEDQQITCGEVDYQKIVNREVLRLRLSLNEAKKLQEETPNLPILVFLHFPPVWYDFVCREIVDVLKEYDIKTCYFGHIHGITARPATKEFEGIEFVLCAADYLSFAPMPIYPEDV